MLKLLRQILDKDGNLIKSEPCGHFRSYANIGKRLHSKGKVGKYYVLPSNATGIASMREIIVTKDEYGKQVEMEGSIY